MITFLVKRLAQMFLTIFLFFTIIFFFIQAQPGSIANEALTNPNFTPEVREQIIRTFGLDKPVWQQYLIFVKNYFTGNMGVSFSLYPRTVTGIIAERLPRTIMLFVTAAVISFYLGFAAGKMIAWRRGSLTEYAATLGGVTLFTVFTPWFALMMIWFFAFKAGWFPVGKFLDPILWSGSDVDANHVFTRMLVTAAAATGAILIAWYLAPKSGLTWSRWIAPGTALASAVVIVAAWGQSGLDVFALDILWHMALPVLTLALISFAATMLLTRNSMLETMREDYVFAARAKGLPEKVVRDRHVARNALLPILTSFVFTIAFAVDGGVIIESIFSWPGMGQTLVSAAISEDLPLAVGALVFTGVFVLVAHLISDLLNMYLDPRLRSW